MSTYRHFDSTQHGRIGGYTHNLWPTNEKYTHYKSYSMGIEQIPIFPMGTCGYWWGSMGIWINNQRFPWIPIFCNMNLLDFHQKWLVVLYYGYEMFGQQITPPPPPQLSCTYYKNASVCTWCSFCALGKKPFLYNTGFFLILCGSQ